MIEKRGTHGNISREARLNAAFVSLADALTAQYDVLEFLHTLVTECTEFLDARAGGLLLADSNGWLWSRAFWSSTPRNSAFVAGSSAP